MSVLLLSMTTVKVLKALIALIPLGVGAVLVYFGLGSLAGPESLFIAGIGGVVAVTGVYQLFEAIAGTDLPDE